MAKSDERKQGDESREAFVSREDRPEVRISLDTPLHELRVRELSAILGYMVGKSPHFEAGKTPLKDFFDKPFPEVVKDWLKELKIEKVEKPEKLEKIEKHEKNEKIEKREKLEKFEVPEVMEPIFTPGPDPRLAQIIQAITGLATQVSQLADQVEKLQKRAPV